MVISQIDRHRDTYRYSGMSITMHDALRCRQAVHS